MTLIEASSSRGVDGSGDDEPPAAVEPIVRAVEARVGVARAEIERMVVHELSFPTVTPDQLEAIEKARATLQAKA